MSKVKLTQEQARMFENHKDAVKTLLQKRVCDNCPTSIDSLSIDDVVKAIVCGYEVKPEFKVGDWVVYEDKTLKLKHIGKYVKSVEDDCSMVDIEEFRVYQKIPNKFLRYATPSEIAEEKERRFFARHGRKPWRLKVGDVLIKKNETAIHEVTSLHDSQNIYFLDYVSATLHEIKRTYKILTFAESRLDVKDDE